MGWRRVVLGKGVEVIVVVGVDVLSLRMLLRLVVVILLGGTVVLGNGRLGLRVLVGPLVGTLDAGDEIGIMLNLWVIVVVTVVAVGEGVVVTIGVTLVGELIGSGLTLTLDVVKGELVVTVLSLALGSNVLVGLVVIVTSLTLALTTPVVGLVVVLRRVIVMVVGMVVGDVVVRLWLVVLVVIGVDSVDLFGKCVRIKLAGRTLFVVLLGFILVWVGGSVAPKLLKITAGRLQLLSQKGQVFPFLFDKSVLIPQLIGQIPEFWFVGRIGSKAALPTLVILDFLEQFLFFDFVHVDVSLAKLDFLLVIQKFGALVFLGFVTVLGVFEEEFDVS